MATSDPETVAEVRSQRKKPLASCRRQRNLITGSTWTAAFALGLKPSDYYSNQYSPWLSTVL